MAGKTNGRHSTSTRTLLARKRTKLRAQSRKAVESAQAAARHGSPGDLVYAATELRLEIASLRSQLLGDHTPGGRAAARALAELETSLAAIIKTAATAKPTQTMAALRAGYLALISAKHAAKEAGHDWPL